MNPRPHESPSSEFAPALALAQAGRYGEAIAQLERAVGPGAHGTRKTAAATALEQVARACEDAGDRSHAERALDVAIRLRPRWADLHFARARVLIALQRRAEARHALDAALAINPRYGAARLERALLDAADGYVGEALEALRALGEECLPEEPHTFEQGLRRLEQAEWEEAAVLLERALQLPHAPVDGVLARYRELMEADEPARAAHVLREALPGREGYPDLHYLLGIAESRLGHDDDALISLARALELNPDFHAARVQFARTLERLGALPQAGEQITLVLLSDRGQPVALALHERWTSRGRRAGAGLVRKAP